MCGIVGVYDYGRTAGHLSDALVFRMRETLHHRGPDGAGQWISQDRRVGLGMRRLAILDIEGGGQPMFGEHGEVLVFNGEIYNYPYLRRDLEQRGVSFRTSCDTEVILRLYERHGMGCLRHLNGMFAFALWDPREEKLFLARDRVGEKPLLWPRLPDGTIAFASELKALVRLPQLRREVDPDALFAAATDTDGRFVLHGSGVERLVSLRLSGGGIADAELWIVNRLNFDPKPYNEAVLDNSFPSARKMFNNHWRLYGPNLSIVAEAGKILRGVVKDADTGAGRPGVVVQLTRNGGTLVSPIVKAKTDAQGRYEIRGARKAKAYMVEVASDPSASRAPRTAVTVPILP